MFIGAAGFVTPQKMAAPLPSPLAIIDFEASSLDQNSYPIECGVAVWEGFGAGVSVWSSLIAPAPLWLRSGRWSQKSERVHGVTKLELGAGLPPAEIAVELNRRLRNIDRVFCDGGDYDRYWLTRLFDAARLEPAFVLNDIGDLFRGYPLEWDRFLRALQSSPQVHRAGTDAQRICNALVEAFAT